MRDEQRIDRILEKVKIIWKNYPDLRFCQLVDILSNLTNADIEMFFLEDDKLEAKLDDIIRVKILNLI